MNNTDNRLFWLKSPDERLKKWREMRKEYTISTQEQLCKDIWHFWMTSPDVSKSIDPYSISMWPTVWEIIHEGKTCKYSRALAAAYTIHYIDETCDIVIARVYDKKNNDIYIASIINDAYVLIPYSNEVENWKTINPELQIEEQFSIENVLDMVKNRTN